MPRSFCLRAEPARTRAAPSFRPDTEEYTLRLAIVPARLRLRRSRLVQLPGGKPKPEVVYREAQDALLTLAGQWKERFGHIRDSEPGKDKTPPVLIIVADNTDIAEVFYRNISGEEPPVQVEDEADGEEQEGTRRKNKAKPKASYGAGKVFPEFSNREGFRPTLRIDTKLLSEAESENATRQEAGEELRKIVGTVGKPGEPGEHVRCVVSVQMLNEGWDARNVTQILGLRAFESQLLCEQVVGRGLRRMDYTPDPETGMLTEEYVDVYGIPFSLIPFKGRETRKPEPEDKPKNHVQAVPGKAMFEIRFPVVENFAFDLRQNAIKADVSRIEKLVLEPDQNPTAVFVKPQVGYQVGGNLQANGFETFEQNREEFYRNWHIQTVKFEIARQVTWALTEGLAHRKAKLKYQARHQLFPQVMRYVEEYVNTRVDWRGCNLCELAVEKYLTRSVERLVSAIEPNDATGEPPLMPILNRYKPIGSTRQVNFITVRPVFRFTDHSHIDGVVADTETWEQSAGFRLEQAAKAGAVKFYARNDHMEFTIPYEFQGLPHAYVPDFVIRLANGVTLIMEIKGQEDEQDRAKHQAAQRWVSAVNNWGQLGRWDFHVCRDPQTLGEDLQTLCRNATPAVVGKIAATGSGR